MVDLGRRSIQSASNSKVCSYLARVFTAALASSTSVDRCIGHLDPGPKFAQPNSESASSLHLHMSALGSLERSQHPFLLLASSPSSRPRDPIPLTQLTLLKPCYVLGICIDDGLNLLRLLNLLENCKDL